MKNLFAVLAVTLLLFRGVAAPAQPVIPTIEPAIKEFPPPIVGNADTTATGKFVYPDALDLTLLGHDDVTPPGSLIWSYSVVGAPHYLINGVAPLNLAMNSPLNPPVAFQINKTVTGAN
jgi:hypothetical protein